MSLPRSCSRSVVCGARDRPHACLIATADCRPLRHNQTSTKYVKDCVATGRNNSPDSDIIRHASAPAIMCKSRPVGSRSRVHASSGGSRTSLPLDLWVCHLGGLAAGPSRGACVDYHSRRQPAHRRRHDPRAFSRGRRRHIRFRRARCGSQGPLRHRPVRRREDCARRRAHPRHRHGKSDHRAARFRGQQKDQRRRFEESRAIESRWAAQPRAGARRRHPHHRALPPAWLLRRQGRSKNHRRKGRSLERRVRDQGRRQARGAAGSICRQQRLIHPTSSRT